MAGLRMNTVQQADIDEIAQNLRDRAYGSAFKRSVMLLNTIAGTDTSAPPVRTRRAGAMAMSAPPMLREEEKSSLDESIDKLESECQYLKNSVSILKAERSVERTQTATTRTTAPQGGKQTTQQGKTATQQGKTAAGSTPEEKGGPKNEGQMTTTQGDAKTPDARKTQQNQSNSPTAVQPVASQEDLEGGQEPEIMGSELSDEPGAAQISPEDIADILGVVIRLWRRFRGQ